MTAARARCGTPRGVDGGGHGRKRRAPAWPPATSSQRGMAVDGGGCNLRQRAPAHGYGRRKMQPPVTSFGVAAGDELRRGAARGQRRTWPPATSPAWRVAAEDATASNKPGVGRGSEGRGYRRRAPTWGVDDEGHGCRRRPLT
ncbi:unknown protein [Oryza sativa Japonica Group]|uniref:Os01g0692400 protein n=2 Tax=Oryza sativa subsp. japonica TaxID=39947 RepID=A0A9K3Y8H6_ORYSJ|nr:unknown protein [Oryza sativa Japonica Group]BAF05856.1 Os01g0692400 [Oryza sativa Japonica Group]BAG99028.1 unnamed protein product [Oryza sativa Japonica Group]BAS73817.1 Os01g0692400 [Oryza sativa Japonica Group]|eukprot:NP_001043942.1 Os01g0692400 [Oryza sativa Japonica Group]